MALAQAKAMAMVLAQAKAMAMALAVVKAKAMVLAMAVAVALAQAMVLAMAVAVAMAMAVAVALALALAMANRIGKERNNNVTEHQEQCRVIQWCDYQATKYRAARKIFAVPNGGQRHIIVATKLKSEGVRKGIPDLFLPVARGGYHGLFIELKAVKGRATEHQTERLAVLTADGYCAVICRGADDAIRTIADYLDLTIV